MKNIFDEETNKRLLGAQTKAEVSAIIAETPMAEAYADKVDLIMNEIGMINGIIDDELVDDEALEQVAGGAKLKEIYLSETTSCVATFFLEDQSSNRFCWSNDQCAFSNEYKYHLTKYSNCKSGGRHNWEEGRYTFPSFSGVPVMSDGYQCTRCKLKIMKGSERFDN